MDATTFTAQVAALAVPDLAAVGAALARGHSCAERLAAARRTELLVEAALRRERRRGEACRAAHGAVVAVRAAAQREGARGPGGGLDHADLVRVARSASLVARALVAGAAVQAQAAELLGPWRAAGLEPAMGARAVPAHR